MAHRKAGMGGVFLWHGPTQLVTVNQVRLPDAESIESEHFESVAGCADRPLPCRGALQHSRSEPRQVLISRHGRFTEPSENLRHLGNMTGETRP